MKDIALSALIMSVNNNIVNVVAMHDNSTDVWLAFKNKY